MTSQPLEESLNHSAQESGIDDLKILPKKSKKELPFAFFSSLTDKQQRQFIARTADLLMQDALFSELSPQPVPSRDQIMSQLREYLLDRMNAK